MDYVVNLSSVPLEHVAHGQRFEARIGRIGSMLGSTQIGCSLAIVPPGKVACPFHLHHGVSEMFIVLEGSGTLRIGTEQRALRIGDVINAPAGGPAHQIINSSQSELRYICISTISTTDVAEYPDSKKIGVDIGDGVLSPPRMLYLHDGREVDYWFGE